MSKNKNDFYYAQEIATRIINLGDKPEDAKTTTDAHLAAGNYDKVVNRVAKEREDEQKLQAYARILSARIHAGEDPQDVVSDMKNDERER